MISYSGINDEFKFYLMKWATIGVGVLGVGVGTSKVIAKIAKRKKNQSSSEVERSSDVRDPTATKAL